MPQVGIAKSGAVGKHSPCLGFFGGVWDKKLTRMYAACTKLRDHRMLDDILSNERFSLWGGAKKPDIAHQAVIEHTISKARSNGILRHMVSKRLCSCNLLKSNTVRKWVKAEIKKDKHLRFQAPSLFWLLKWKSKENRGEAKLKWRDVDPYSRNIFRRYARLVGRSLQLLIKELSHMGIGIGFPRMFGVRDQTRGASRYNTQMGGGCPLVPTEMDMDDMCWEIPTLDVSRL